MDMHFCGSRGSANLGGFFCEHDIGILRSLLFFCCLFCDVIITDMGCISDVKISSFQGWALPRISGPWLWRRSSRPRP